MNNKYPKTNSRDSKIPFSALKGIFHTSGMHFFALKRISHHKNMQFAHSTIFHPSAPKREYKV